MERRWRQTSHLNANAAGAKDARRAAVTGLGASLLFASVAWSQAGVGLQSATQLKQLSLDELLNLEVTSVSRRPEKLASVASAIQVISGDNIRRSAATSIPEALRLAPNLQVAQVNASQWAISARGFNNVLANKLLVMIDGRTVYTPMYAGVYWDVQDTLMEDIDRIEVVSGPGGTLWGANAVNGVINIITQSAGDTQGLFLEAGGGDELHAFGGARYGGAIGDVAYRVYGKAFNRDDTVLAVSPEDDARDAWHGAQGGFRSDWDTDNRTLTLQGDVYYTNPNPNGGVGINARGHNVLGRWQEHLSERSDFHIQLYYDYSDRDLRNGFIEKLTTYDVDAQHRFALGSHQEIVWGLGARWAEHSVTNTPQLGFRPPEKSLRLYSAFIQDEISLLDDTLRVTVGSKFERNDYTGTEPQPSARVAWTPAENNTLWAAASRATRTPSRLDRELYSAAVLPPPFIPEALLIVGADVQSEKVRAYEVGWRSQAGERISSSLALFYNQYDYLRSAEPGPGYFLIPSIPLGFIPNLPASIGNGVAGHTKGVELSATYAATDSWQLRGGYTYVRKYLHVKPDSRDLNNATTESNDPDHQATLQSMWSLPGNIDLDGVLRYVDMLPQPHVDSYVELDLRLAWRPVPTLEISVAGQNLLADHHAEFIPASPSPREIERGVYGEIAWRY
jgi:iron complex outermembrane receptor protein